MTKAEIRQIRKYLGELKGRLFDFSIDGALWEGELPKLEKIITDVMVASVNLFLIGPKSNTSFTYREPNSSIPNTTIPTSGMKKTSLIINSVDLLFWGTIVFPGSFLLIFIGIILFGFLSELNSDSAICLSDKIIDKVLNFSAK